MYSARRRQHRDIIRHRKWSSLRRKWSSPRDIIRERKWTRGIGGLTLTFHRLWPGVQGYYSSSLLFFALAVRYVAQIASLGVMQFEKCEIENETSSGFENDVTMLMT